MKILIAPNAFKNSLTAEAAATAIAEGFIKSRLDCVCECFPVGDGGDGTAALILKKCAGTVVETAVHGPLGKKINTSFGLIDNGKTAVIEMANAAGLRLLQQTERNPLLATSFGTGEQIKMALEKGVTKIIIGMGGSATVDGGCGILAAMGVQFMDANGLPLAGLPGNFPKLYRIDTSMLDKRIFNTEVIVLCDVDNLLLGNNGAAAMFGPQKGASAEAVRQLNTALSKFAAVTLAQTGKDIAGIKYGGTAGGAAAGLFAWLNAKLVNGIEHFLLLTAFDESLEKANVVVTGEGSIDEQTLQGKGPFGVAHHAKQKNIPVIALAGKIPLEENRKLSAYFDVLLAIGNQPEEIATAIKSTRENLVRTAMSVGNLLTAKLHNSVTPFSR